VMDSAVGHVALAVSWQSQIPKKEFGAVADVETRPNSVQYRFPMPVNSLYKNWKVCVSAVVLLHMVSY